MAEAVAPVRNISVAAKYAINGAIILYYIILTAIHLHYRASPGLKRRSVLLTVLLSIACCVFTLGETLRLTNVTSVCAVTFWMINTGLGLMLSLITSRAIRLLSLFATSEAFLANSSYPAVKASTTSTSLIGDKGLVSTLSSATTSIRRIEETSDLTRLCRSAQSPPSSESRLVRFIKRLCYQYREYLSVEWLLVYSGVILFLLSALSLAINLTSPTLLGERPTCIAGIREAIPIYVTIAVFACLLWPTLGITMARTRDAYGVHIELFAMVAVFILGLVANVIVRSHGLYFTVPTISIAGMLVYLVASIAPVVDEIIVKRLQQRHRRDRSHLASADKQSFDDIFHDKVRFQEFKAFTVKDFTVENTLFYERCMRFRELQAKLEPSQPASRTSVRFGLQAQAKPLLSGGGKSATYSPLPSATYTTVPSALLPPWIRNDLIDTYDQFIKPDSQYEINLDEPIANAIRKRIEADDLSLTMYRDAEQSIYNLMYYNSYPRFLRAQNKQAPLVRKKGRILLQSGGK